MQGLIGGVLALIAAIGSVFWIHTHRKYDMLRKLWFAKSEAIFAVIDLHDSLDLIVKSLEIDYFKFKKKIGEEITSESFEVKSLPSYSNESLKTLSKLIPVSNHRTASELAELIAYFQIYKSRLSSFEEQCNNGSHPKSIRQFHQTIYEQVELSSWLMQKVLPYVRDNMKSENMPNFKEQRDASLVFSRKQLLFDVEYQSYCKEMSWPPNLGAEIEEWKK